MIQPAGTHTVRHFARRA